MSRDQLLGMLLVTAVMGALAVKTWRVEHDPFRAFIFAAVPTCGWLAFIFGR